MNEKKKDTKYRVGSEIQLFVLKKKTEEEK